MRRLALLAVLALAGCGDSEQQAVRLSENSLKIAISNGTAAELEAMGYRIKGEIKCRTSSGDTRELVRVECDGLTDIRKPIKVDGTARKADTAHPVQEFVITIDGIEVLRKDCLAAGCK